jgi:uncharacterized protein YgiM (DUF1202 family)
MAFLTVIVVILAIMSANKPPVAEAPPSAEEETTTRVREPLFPLNPVGEEEEVAQNIYIDPEDEGEEEDDPDSDISRMDVLMYATATVNVRAGNNAEFDRIGSLASGQEVRVIGRSKETDWYLIEFGDGEGFVSFNYLSENAPQPAPTPPPPENDQNDDSGQND